MVRGGGCRSWCSALVAIVKFGDPSGCVLLIDWSLVFSILFYTSVPATNPCTDDPLDSLLFFRKTMNSSPQLSVPDIPKSHFPISFGSLMHLIFFITELQPNAFPASVLHLTSFTRLCSCPSKNCACRGPKISSQFQKAARRGRRTGAEPFRIVS